MTPKQAACTGMQEYFQRVKGRDEIEKHDWAVARWQEYRQTMLSPFIKQANRPNSPKDLLLFPGETKGRDDITPEMCHVSEETQAVLSKMMEDFISRKQSRNE